LAWPLRRVPVEIGWVATQGERKALMFFGFVAILGAGVRVWRGVNHADRQFPRASSYEDDSAAQRGPVSGRRTSVRKPRAPSSRSRTYRDSNSVIDIDRASVAEIDALGVLPKGMGRLIVADRDSFGPFGSLDELRRVPFLTVSTLRKLAPRVTFSRVPRPRNTVIDPRTFRPEQRR
jgi:DNA uptake protein ComE-like DNA-binding protein